MTADNLVLGRGKLYFAPYATGTTTGGTRGYFGNTPTLTMAQTNTKLDHYSSEGGLKIKDRSVLLQTDITLTFDTDNISPANLQLWFGGTDAGTLPSDAPSGLGTLTVIGKASQIYGALFFESDNPVGDNTNYWFPYVSLAPNGNYALKGDAWQVLSFTAEALKRDSLTERLYAWQPGVGASTAQTDVTAEMSAASIDSATGGSGSVATGGTVTAPSTGTHAVALTASYTLTGGTLAYVVLNNGTTNQGSPQAVSGASGTVSLTPASAGTYTVKLTSDSAGADVLATSGAITVS